MPPRIVWLRGNHIGKTFELEQLPLTLGRSPENTVMVGSARASRRHAEIRSDAGGFLLIDLESANGTLVNGTRLDAPYRLRAGDLFEVGDDLFRFEAPLPEVGTTQFGPALSPQPTTAPPIASPKPLPNRPRQRPRWLLVLLLIGVVVFVAAIGAAVVATRSGPTGQNTPLPDSTATLPENTNEALPSTEILPTATPASVSTANPPTTAPVSTLPDWTVLVYLDGDNGLEADAIGDFNEMELVGSSERVKIVVQLDRITTGSASDDTSNGNWDSTKRFLVQKNDDPIAFGSQELADLGELNSGDPQALADFIVWGVQQFPAQRYALIIWDHGSAWAGIAFDDTNNEDGINMLELGAALRTAQAQTGVEKLDLIGFDACLMAQLDVFMTVAPYGKTAVASAELEPNEGWAWDIWLATLQNDPSQDAPGVARAIVDSYRQFYTNGDNTVTLSAFDLERIDTVRNGFGRFSDAMIANISTSYQAIAEARSYADTYSQPRPEEFNAVDLGHFARLTGERGAPASVAEPAQALISAIEQARIAEWNGGFHANSTGISIYFPQVAELYPDYYAQVSPLPQQTSWSQFLSVFYSGGVQVSAPQITGLTLSSTTVGVNSPLTIQGTISGNDIAYVFFFVGTPNADNTGVLLTDIDFIYPPGAMPGDTAPVWVPGSNTLNQTWNGTQWGISNGTDTIPVLLGPARYGTNLYGVEGFYIAQNTNEQINAALLFRLEGGRAILQNFYGFPQGQNLETQPFEISPQPGDRFTAVRRSYSIQGGQLVPGRIEGDTITIGNTPLSAIQIPVNSGDYMAGFLVRDIAGRFNYQYQNIQVDNSGAGAKAPPGISSSGAGTQAGTLRYTRPDLGLALEYPDDWQTFDTGSSQIYFFDPAEIAVFVSVESYALNQPETANQTVLDAYLAALGAQTNFTQQSVEAVTLANGQALQARYSYTDERGTDQTGIATTITSPTSGLSYLIVAQAPTAEFERRSAALEQVLGSLQIE